MAVYNFSDEQLLSLVSENIPVSEMAIRLGVDYEDLFAHYAVCSARDRKAFPIALLLTESWLQAKLASTPVSVISQEVQVSPSVIHRLAKKYGIKARPTIRDLLSRDVLYDMYIGQGYTDKAIAAQYNCSIELIKKLRKQYGISPDSRYTIVSGISIEFFHRLYVTYGFTAKQLIILFDCTQYQLKQMITNFSAQDHPLASEIKNRKKGRFSLLIEKLMATLDPTLILEQLKTKTLAEVCELYEIIPPAEPGAETFSKEWLAALLKKMDLEEIKRQYYAGPLLISSLMEEGKLHPIPPIERLEEALVRKLYLELLWSDAQIADIYNTSVFTVRAFRKKHGIRAADQLSLSQRLSADEFEQLYLHEGLTIAQIATLYGVPAIQVRDLKRQCAMLNPAITRQKSSGAPEERLQFLAKQLHFKGFR